MMRMAMISLVAIGLFAPTDSRAEQENPVPANPQTADLTLTTKSPEVQRLIEEAWRLSVDLVEQAQAGDVLRKAIKLDPNFAFAHEILAQTSLDPAEQISEQKKAFATRRYASDPERMIIEWLQDSADNKLMSAVTTMNDVLSKYPHDKWVVFLSISWLMQQTQYERAVIVYERSRLNNCPGLMNKTAYSYAYMRQFDKAFELMDKYVAALPNDANPQDSYAEILRMAGNFDKAIEHYRASVSINPDFYSSQFGIADTYSLMGKQARAREEYKAAFHRFPSLPELDRIQFQTREATTYVREANYAAGDHAFQRIARYAHSKQMSWVEADTYRQMAMYQQNPNQSLLFLDKAQAAIKEGKNATPGARDQEFAQILRVRVETAVKMGHESTARFGVMQLHAMSESSSDRIIETAYHGADGTELFFERKYNEAISHLEEDITNPLSLKLLAAAYQQIGYSAGAKRTTETLANLNDPTLEQALIVPTFRKCYQEPTCSGNVMAVSMKKATHSF
ncbi:MAG: hypothetical protein NVS9B5_37140 [Terriglobales bacterium]